MGNSVTLALCGTHGDKYRGPCHLCDEKRVLAEIRRLRAENRRLRTHLRAALLCFDIDYYCEKGREPDAKCLAAPGELAAAVYAALRRAPRGRKTR